MKRCRQKFRSRQDAPRRYLVVAVYSGKSGVKLDKDEVAEKIMGDGYTGTGFDLERGRRDVAAEYRLKAKACSVARALFWAGFKVEVVDTRCPVNPWGLNQAK